MFCEVFNRLSEFGRVDSYRYIGFGSIFFSDFSLFHRSLNITNNVSIERQYVDRERFELNRPYNCIDLIFGESNEILPILDWNVKTIIWLDYDSPLSDSILADIIFVCTYLQPGSLLIVTVDAEPDDIGHRVRLLRERVDDSKIPVRLIEESLVGWNTAKTSRRIITNEIASTINARNGGRQEGEKLSYKQLFNFHYADGRKMLTVGGLLHDESQSDLVAKCGFKDFDFIKDGEEAYEIDVPNLTLREIHYLNKQLPSQDISSIEAFKIPLEDIIKYAKIYRYFPLFVVAEIG